MFEIAMLQAVPYCKSTGLDHQRQRLCQAEGRLLRYSAQAEVLLKNFLGLPKAEISSEEPMSMDKINVGFGCRLHALAGSGSGTLQYFFGGEVFFMGSNCPNVSEWIL